MNRKTGIIILLQALLIVTLFWMLVFYGKDEYEAFTSSAEEEIETPSLVSSELGATVVTLSSVSQSLSGIRTSALKPGKHQKMLASYGRVVSIDPLLELRTRYLAARAEANVVRASLSSSEQEYQRVRHLYEDDRNLSQRALIAAEALWKADQARLAAAEMSARSIRDTMRQQWGEVLSSYASQPVAAPVLENLLQYRKVLLQITLPADAPAPMPGSTLVVAPISEPAKSIRAKFISASPLADPSLQGKTYFYTAADSELRSGMRVSMLIPASDKSSSGVVVPDSAVVWYGGKAWVYRQQDTEKFVRVAINTDRETADGWFNHDKLNAGDAVVTSGAQLLLSEEFKYQIKNENDD